jgi:hypothetical protein
MKLVLQYCIISTYTIIHMYVLYARLYMTLYILRLLVVSKDTVVGVQDCCNKIQFWARLCDTPKNNEEQNMCEAA